MQETSDDILAQYDIHQPDFDSDCPDCTTIVQKIIKRLSPDGDLYKYTRPDFDPIAEHGHHNQDTKDPVSSLEIGRKYTRNYICDVFGVKPSKYKRGINLLDNDRILLFNSNSSPYHNIPFVQYGIYLYTGEGSKGDQKPIIRNRCLKDSFTNNTAVYLAWKCDKEYEYIGRIRLLYTIKVQHHDINNNPRNVYMFILKAID